MINFDGDKANFFFEKKKILRIENSLFLSRPFWFFFVSSPWKLITNYVLEWMGYIHLHCVWRLSWSATTLATLTKGTYLNSSKDVSLCCGWGELAKSNKNLRNSGHKLLPINKISILVYTFWKLFKKKELSLLKLK